VNEFVKRVRAARIHILIMGHLRKQMPSMMGKAKAQASGDQGCSCSPYVWKHARRVSV